MGALPGMSIAYIVFTLACSVLVAELAGYALHRVMHSDRFPAMSRAHLIHHLLIYGPKQPMRTAEYNDATTGRAYIGNVGLEWVVPSGMILCACWPFLWLRKNCIGYPFHSTRNLLALSA